MTDALERIKNRQRPEVPKRDPSIASSTIETVDSSLSDILDADKHKLLDIQISTLPDHDNNQIDTERLLSRSLDASQIKISAQGLKEVAANVKIVDSSTHSDLETDIPKSLDIQISTPLKLEDRKISGDPSPVVFEVKQTTIRLEKAINNKLQALCHQEEICREVLIEAMFLEMENTPKFYNRIMIQAQERQMKRTAIANRKRAFSMMQRLSD